METSSIIKKIRKYLKTEDRKDIEFRALLALTELGDIVKYITHDQKLNPNARPYGTKDDEIMAYGQALVQTLATMVLRGINIEKAIKIGLKNWAEGDWRRRKRKEKKISGVVAFPGNARGKAYILSEKHSVKKMPKNSILIASMIKPDMISYLTDVIALVSDNGGITSHAAIIARELRIPCIVGTGNASQIIPHGSNVKIIATGGKGLVELG